MLFVDRVEAGRQLAGLLERYRGPDTVVVGLPRGGVPVAAEVASALGAPLDVLVVRKLGVPFQPEFAMGALGEGGAVVVDAQIVAQAQVSQAEFDHVVRAEQAELARRLSAYRQVVPALDLHGRTVVVVDDGIATGSTARAACQVARARGAARVVLAAPVGAPDTVRRLRTEADEVVCNLTPTGFGAVGRFYADFSPVADETVIACLHRSRLAPSGVSTDGGVVAEDDCPVFQGEVAIRVTGADLVGRLVVPEDPRGLVVFAHGSGSSRNSPRNRQVAGVLQEAALGTLLVDLLTPTEELHRTNVFDIELLARRLGQVTGWLRARGDTGGLPVGYFGASTGAGAALWAASEPGSAIAAVVSRGGRPDLAGDRLVLVRAPTLLIVGGSDEIVLGLNREAQARLGGVSQLTVVPGATHLFEEPGALAQVATLARDWFLTHLSAPPG